jgi:List-Bact-rpt repeat protein
MSRKILTVLGVSLFAATVGARGAGAQTTALYVDVQPGSPIGAASTHSTFTMVNALFSTNGTTADQARFYIELLGDGDRWDLEFRASSTGTYERATSNGFGPHFVVQHNLGPGCAEGGRFVVYEATYGSGGTLQTFAADFEAHCGDTVAGVFGAVRYNAQRASLDPFNGAYRVNRLDVGSAVNGYVAGDGIFCGAGHTQCAATFSSPATVTLQATANPGYMFVGWIGACRGEETAVIQVYGPRTCTPVFGAQPGSGLAENPSYADGAISLHYLAGDADDVPTRRVLTPAETDIWYGVSTAGGVIAAVTIMMNTGGASDLRYIQLGARPGAALTAGTYEYAGSTGGPTISTLGGDGCTTGRFRIYELETTGATVTRFSADFEFVCGSAPTRTLAGAVRHHSTLSSLVPYDGDYLNYTLRITPTLGGSVVGTGILCGSGATDCEERYPSVTSAGLSAVAEPGYAFGGWGGSCTGSTPAQTVVVNTVVRCFAVFVAQAAGRPSDPLLAEGTVYLDTRGSESASRRNLWLSAAANFAFTGSSTNVILDVDEYWVNGIQVVMRIPGGIPGDYDDPDTPRRVDVSGCDERASRLRVYELVYSGSVLTSLAADFEVYCSGSAISFMAGAIRYHSSRASIQPFDGAYPVYRLKVQPPLNGIVTSAGIECGPARTDCEESYPVATRVELRATPLPGYRFVAWTGSCSGDAASELDVTWVRSCSAVFNAQSPGAGTEDARIRQHALLVDDEGPPLRRASLDTSTAGFRRENCLEVTVNTETGGGLGVTLQAPFGSGLQPGVYDNARGFSARGCAFASGGSTTALMLVSGCSRFDPIEGRFIIHEIAFGGSSGTQLTSLAADVEQRCSPTSPTLRAAIRFNSSRSQLIPFDTAVSGGCTTPDPYASTGAGICTAGVWSAPSPVTPPATPPSTTACATPDPFITLGGGTCYNGGWLPPGMGSGGSGGSSGSGSGGSSSSAGCATPDPFVTLGGGTCYNGGWLPPGMTAPSQPPAPPPPSPSGCVGPDPFASIPTLVGVCINGGWVPTVR